MIRLADWKLHHYFEDKGVELDNLKNDAGERSKLAQTNPAKTKELLTLLNSCRKEVNAPAPTQKNPNFKN